MQSAYRAALATNGSVYSRDKCGTEKYYYQALRINVSCSDRYAFFSSSHINTYAYLYQYKFDPLDPSRNLIAYNDDGCDYRQFWLDQYLLTNTTYILVVTTYSTGVRSYSLNITTAGYARVNLTLLGESQCLRVE